jgi:hypothetical protein
MADATVLATFNDPFRLDTPANHRLGAWLAVHFNRLVGPTRRIHLRGLHYALVAAADVLKPDGTPYINDDANWGFLQSAMKPARWLGHVPFARIFDARNAEPVIHRREAPDEPASWVGAGYLDVEIPPAEELVPFVGLSGFEARQPRHIVMFGEKTSLSDVLLPIAEEFDTDVYLPSGEISDALLWRMARDGADDGRPMVVLTLSDCDPAGWQMPVSIGRKLQALRDLCFPDLEFEVHPVALTPEQVRELGLPSTPLKPGERRADRWRAAFGTAQTEIDALAALRPDELRRLVREAIEPHWDATLRSRLEIAETEWRVEAGRRLVANTDGAALAQLIGDAAATLDAMREGIDALNERAEGMVSSFELPAIEVPEARLRSPRRGSRPLVSTAWSWAEQTRSLKPRKTYGGDEP